MWKDNLYHGSGFLKSKDHTYQGDFSQGLKKGHGIQKWINSSKFYEGEFDNDLFDGNGLLKFNDKKYY